MKIEIDATRCSGCGICQQVCPQMIVEVVDGTMQVHDQGRCMGCFGCEDECPSGAVRVLRAPLGVTEIEIEPPLEGVTSCDVAVVGAGPAGLGAAIACARAGLDVVVFERLPNRRISHHPDGGVLFTLPWMTSMEMEGGRISFPELDISLGAGFARRCGAMGLLGPGGLSTDNQMPAGVEGWAGNKDRFVEALVGEAEAAGARMWFNAKVNDLLKVDGRVTGVRLDTEPDLEPEIGAEIGAKVVVAADGVMAKISEKAGLPVSNDDLWYASVLAFEYENAPDLPAGLYYLNGGLQWEEGMPSAFGGVGITDVVHVMIVFFSRERAYPAPKPMDYYLERMLARDERVQSLLGGSLRGVKPKMLTGCRAVFRARCNERTAGDGVISVGDAWVDDGELGNVPALANGVYAGRVIVEAAKRDDFSRAALRAAEDFLDKRLLRVLTENKKMKLLGAELDDEGQRQMFLFMQHLNYPVMMLGTPRQQGMMFASFVVKNLFRFLRYPRVGRLFF
jgi:electron transfer flavoprotein-quinone oxidoreductase